ncbi:MAG: glycosyltransferase [Candidatus Chisholmbacteria bacterium]|nr:glycosyltransferase [Candidatus Chisholmbacteria bacterium]
MSPKPNYDVSFVIPFHNEEDNVGPMLERVLKFGEQHRWRFEVVPINDRSNDKTGEILKRYKTRHKNIHPISRHDGGELGNTMGQALKLGTKNAHGRIIIWTMGDLSDDTKTYEAIVAKIQTGLDMVFGSRYMPGGSPGNLSFLKAFLSANGTLLARILFGVPVHDITNAFRGFRKNVFSTLNLASTGFDISPEFAIKAHQAGFKLGEVPTVYTNRERGIPKFKLWKMTRTYLSVYAKLLFHPAPKKN